MKKNILSKREIITPLKLCIDCPLFGKYVPAAGNCFTLIPSGDRQETIADIKMPTQPGDFFYNPLKKCPYFKGTESGGITGKLRGIGCSYSASQ